MRAVVLSSLLTLVLSFAGQAQPLDPAPTRVGQCSDTSVKEVTSRFGALEGEFGSEDSILSLTNGLDLYLYRKLRTMTHPGWGITPDSGPIGLSAAKKIFRANDRVKLCLEYIPADCDARERLGDSRGEIYFISNYRNNKTAFGHLGRNGCGGA